MSRKFSPLLAAFAVIVSAGVASASVQFDLNFAYNYNDSVQMLTPVSPSGPSPWLRVTVFDNTDLGHTGLSANELNIQIDSFLTSTDFVDKLALNFSGNATERNSLGFTQIASTGAFLPVLNANVAKTPSNVDGSSTYDLSVDFQAVRGVPSSSGPETQ